MIIFLKNIDMVEKGYLEVLLASNINRGMNFERGDMLYVKHLDFVVGNNRYDSEVLTDSKKIKEAKGSQVEVIEKLAGAKLFLETKQDLWSIQRKTKDEFEFKELTKGDVIYKTVLEPKTFDAEKYVESIWYKDAGKWLQKKIFDIHKFMHDGMYWKIRTFPYLRRSKKSIMEIYH